MATKLIDLIEKVNADDLPTNEFTIEDKDPMVILGKLNEVIAYLQTLQATINSSDSKANEALQKAIQAVADATQALSVANGIDAKATQALANAVEAVSTANSALSASNTALSTANTAISTANTALSSANSAVETAENALDTAGLAENKADTAISTANSANSKAQEALDHVVAGKGTKVYRGSQLLSSLDIKPIEDNIAENTTAITALQNGKVDKVTGKQLSTEDFTTAEKNKLAGLNNYNDTQVKADITALQNAISALGIKYKDIGAGGNFIYRRLICVGGMGIFCGETTVWADASSITLSYGVTFLNAPIPVMTFTKFGADQYADGKWVGYIETVGFKAWNASNTATSALVIAVGPIDANTID